VYNKSLLYLHNPQIKSHMMFLITHGTLTHTHKVIVNVRVREKDKFKGRKVVTGVCVFDKTTIKAFYVQLIVYVT